MSLIFKLALRNLFRHKRRTFLTTFAMSAGTALLILTLGINDGFLWSMIIQSTEYYHGHFQMNSHQYEEERDFHHTVSSSKAPKIPQSFSLQDPAPRLVSTMLAGIAKKGKDQIEKTRPVMLLGIDPPKEILNTKIHHNVLQGEFLSNQASNNPQVIDRIKSYPILLGEQLSENLEARIGSELIAMGQGARGSIASARFHVHGVFSSSDQFRDSQLALVKIDHLQEILGFEGQAHQWILSTSRPLEVNELKEKIQQLNPDLIVKSWRDLLPQLSQVLDIWDVTQLILVFIFYFAVILITSNTMSMAILERTRELSILRAIGLFPFQVSTLVILEGFYLSLFSAIFGLIFGCCFSFLLNSYPIDLSPWFGAVSWGSLTIEPMIRAYPTVENTILPFFLMLLLGPVTCLIPMLRFFLKPLASTLGTR